MEASVKEREPLRATIISPEGQGLEPIQVNKVPGQIPASMMTSTVRSALETFLTRELSDAEGERAEFMQKLRRWEIAYQAPLPLGPKHFPIFNASNLTIPVIKEAVNTLAAQLVQATDTARPRWVLKDMAKEWEPFIERMEKFLDMASDRDMNLSPVITDWVVECTKLGTSIVEVPWEVDERRIYKYDEIGMKVYPSKVVLQDGPAPYHIPLQKFWIRFAERDVQKAKWVAKEMEYSEEDLLRKQAQGIFHSIDAIIKRTEDRDTDIVNQAKEKIEKTTPIKRKFTVFEVWLSWPIDKSGLPVECKLYYHRDTGKLIGEFFNPYWHGKRPFIKIGYFPQPDRFYDQGLCEMLEQIQLSISAIVNGRQDNISMANAKMILKRRTVRNLMPGDPLYGAKIIEVNDPNSDLREFQLAEVYPSTVNEERLMQGRAERVAGTNEGIAGAAMPVTRTTASAQIALLQEQAKRIDLTVREIRRGIQEIGWYGMQLYSQFGTNGKAVAWLGTRGLEVEAVFRLPRRVLEIGVSLHAQTPTSMQNKQVQRENKIAMFNLLLQLHKEIFPLAAQYAPPETMAMVAAGAIKGAQKYTADVLAAFEEPDPEGILASLSVLEKVLPRMENLGGLEDIERGVEASQILERIAGLERLAATAEAAAANGNGDGARKLQRERASAPSRVPPGSDGLLLVGGPPSGGQGSGNGGYSPAP